MDNETVYTTHPVSCLSLHNIGECYIQQWLTGKCYISHYPNHNLYKTCVKSMMSPVLSVISSLISLSRDALFIDVCACY